MPINFLLPFRYHPLHVLTHPPILTHPPTYTPPGEYMVSAVVRAPPSQCLRVLMDPASQTSILGPATEVEVIESQHGRQVLRVRVQAPGLLGQWFRPRECVVQRLLKKEEDGVFVLLFSSRQVRRRSFRVKCICIGCGVKMGTDWSFRVKCICIGCGVKMGTDFVHRGKY